MLNVRRPGADEDTVVRTAQTIVADDDGTLVTVIAIGVPEGHLLADPDSATLPGGLRDARIGPMRLPAPPVFMISRGSNVDSEAYRERIRRLAGIATAQRVVHIESESEAQHEIQVA